MGNTYKYRPGDLAVIVRPAQRAHLALSGKKSWREIVSGWDTAWAISADKADRATLLIAVHEDVIRGAWRIISRTHHFAVPDGKTRPVNRTHFETAPDARLAYLLGSPSPKALPRNPQGVMELRDLPGADALISDEQPAEHGVVRLGPYTLTVRKDGGAELRIPADAALTIRPFV
ncbi:hypothetical protein HUT17_05105 (plasmid) [Nocardiopsis flavescens]|nr:hypothetical protein HUT17_05105 [Nocardiopsis flavescens]